MSPRLVPLPMQGGSEKLGDEDLEAVLDKVVRMLAYISGEGREGRRPLQGWPMIVLAPQAQQPAVGVRGGRVCSCGSAVVLIAADSRCKGH